MKLRGRRNKQPQVNEKMHFKRKNEQRDSPQRPIPSSPKHYSGPEGRGQLDVEGRRKRIHVLLDSGAGCFLLSV